MYSVKPPFRITILRSVTNITIGFNLRGWELIIDSVSVRRSSFFGLANVILKI